MKIDLHNSNNFPMVVIGTAVLDFKKVCKDPIIHIESISMLREVISNYSSVNHLDRLLVIEDLSFLGSQGEGLLLKFVEETKLKVVLLSVYDVVSSVLLSRARVIVKYQREKTDSQFLSLVDGQKKLDEYTEQHDSPYYTKVKMMGRLSPKLYFLDKKIGNRSNKSKILTLLE